MKCAKNWIESLISISLAAGGDPILHKNFWKLAEKLKENNIRWAILGNPFHLNDEAYQKLYDYGCVKYQLSLDVMREIHDIFRNIADFPELIDLCAEKEADVFAFGRYCPTSGQKSEEYHIMPNEYRNFLDMYYNKFQEHKKNVCKTTFQFKDHLWTLYLYENELFHIPENHDPDMIYDGCHCGIRHITILPTGDVYACR